MSQMEYIQHYLSPLVGWMQLRVSDHGVRSLTFVQGPFMPQAANQSPIMDLLVYELDRYFKGTLKRFLVPIEQQQGTIFQRNVWAELSKIPYGETRSYAEIAAAIGRSKASRAVGSANGENSIPIIIPCHRVIKSDGSLGGYAPGPDIKKKLLELEGMR